ncbi:MAG: phospholipid carrier-dependent glycosyltransferase [Deltaproteobacteria bacterium]|nr:phospholipid carrier-dependent glycosyltransferase [Deltaproteobacteria bacterium]
MTQLIGLAGLAVWALGLERRLSIAESRLDGLLLVGVLGLSSVVVLIISLGGLGLLHSSPLLIVEVALGAVGLRWLRRPRTLALPATRGPSRSTLLVMCAVGAVFVLPFALRAVLYVPVDWDSLNYHLFYPATWLQQGEIVRLAWPYPHDHLTYYPQNGELLITALMGVLENDLLAETFGVPLIIATALATVAIARELGARGTAAYCAGLLVITTPAMLSWAATGYVEPLRNFGTLCGLLFVIRAGHAPPGGAARWALLAGLAAGLAVGTKYNALPSAAVTGLLLSLTLALRRVGPRPWLASCACFAGGLLLTGGYWYLRNAIDTGNPFYPVPFLGLPHITGPASLARSAWEASSIAANFSQLLESGALQQVLVGSPWAVASRMAVGWKLYLLLPLTVLSIVGVAVRLGRRGISDRRCAAQLQTLVLLLTCLSVYLTTPYWNQPGWLQSNVRFAVPLVCLGAALSAATLGTSTLGLRVLVGLSLLAPALDLPFLDLRVPVLGALATWIVIAVAAGLGAVATIVPRLRWPLLLAVIAAMLALPPALLSYREANRYRQLETHVEVHPSLHRPFNAVASKIEEIDPDAPVALAISGPAEFPYLFVGRWLQRPVLFVSYAPTPSESHERAWLGRLKGSPARYLITLRNDPHRAWPAELRWAMARRWPVLYQDPYARIFRLPKGQARADVSGAPEPRS